MPATTAPGSRRCGSSPARIAASPTASAAIRRPTFPDDPAKYSQDIARDDVIALMDALKIDKAHVVGHSMGAYTALHVGIHYPEALHFGDGGRLRLGLERRIAKKREEMKALAAETGKMFAEEGIAAAAAKYADAPMRQAQKNKDPRGYAEFARMLAEHSAEGHAQTMFNLQLKRPTLWEMEAALKKFSRAAAGASSATRTSPASTAACFSSARCRPPGCW